jgi:hypothetical protein
MRPKKQYLLKCQNPNECGSYPAYILSNTGITFNSVIEQTWIKAETNKAIYTTNIADKSILFNFNYSDGDFLD